MVKALEYAALASYRSMRNTIYVKKMLLGYCFSGKLAFSKGSLKYFSWFINAFYYLFLLFLYCLH